VVGGEEIGIVTQPDELRALRAIDVVLKQAGIEAAEEGVAQENDKKKAGAAK
jgi:hypothetical protein